MTVRHATPDDLPRLHACVDAIASMPAASRYQIHHDMERSLRGDEWRIYMVLHGDRVQACAGARRIESTTAFVDIDWMLVNPEAADPKEQLRKLVRGVRDFVPSGLRFLGGRWQLGGLDPHALDGSGLERSGEVANFYGPGDDLVVWVAKPVAAEESLIVDPSNPAALYDAAFGYRDFEFERDFLLACASHFGSGRPSRVASWGCSSGRHLRAFGQIGIGGIGIDDSRDALDLAKEMYVAAVGNVPAAEWIHASLEDRVVREPVDLSYSMLSVVHKFASETALAKHLEHVATLLNPGGVHVIEATQEVDATQDGNTQTHWTERRGPFLVQSRFHIVADQRSSDGTVPTVLDVRCVRQDDRAVVGVLQQQERWLVPSEQGWRDIVARVPSLELVTFLGDFQLAVSSTQVGAWRTIVVLRRKDGS